VQKVGGDDAAKGLASFMPQEEPEPPARDGPVKRWDKALLAINGIAKQCAKFDKDGLEVMVVGEEVKPFEGVKDVAGVMKIVQSIEPEGGLCLAPAITLALEQATTRLYSEEGSGAEQNILVLLSKEPDDAEEVTAAIQEAASKVKTASDLSITIVHVGSDSKAEEYVAHLDENLKVTSAETGEEIDIVDTLKSEDIAKAFEESQAPGFMNSGGTGALMGAFAGMAGGAGAYYAYQKTCIGKRTQGFNGKWYVIGYDGQKTSVHLEINDDMEGNLAIKGYPDEEPEEFEGGFEEEWDNHQNCPCCQGRGYFDVWGRPCEEESMHKDIDCPVCGGEGAVDGEMVKCRKCQGKGAISSFGQPCMKNHMHFEKDCPKCDGRCFFPRGADDIPEPEEDEPEPLPLHGASTAKAKYQGEKVWRFTADEETVIPGTVEDESTVAWEDGTRWEEKKEKVSYGKMALAGLGGAAVGGAAGFVIQKKFFNKASKQTPGDYVIILDSSSGMKKFDMS